MWPEDRRVRVLWVDEESVLHAIRTVLSDAPPDPYRLRFVCSSPALSGSALTAVRCTHSWERRAFGFLVHHESFDPVPDGSIPPDIGHEFRWEYRLDTPEPFEPVVVGGQ